MIHVICKDGTFLAKGTFAMGLAGVFRNEDFEDETIAFGLDLKRILEDMESEDHFYCEPLLPYLKTCGRDGDAIAQGLEAYYNQKEREAQAHSKEINNCILYHLFDFMEACGCPFWNIEEAVLPGSLNGWNRDELEEKIYPADSPIYRWGKYFDDVPNNGTVEKPDVEAELRKRFPMFNFDGLYKAVIPESLTLEGRYLSVQFSDRWGGELFCSAYDQYDEAFSSTDWHNF